MARELPCFNQLIYQRRTHAELRGHFPYGEQTHFFLTVCHRSCQNGVLLKYPSGVRGPGDVFSARIYCDSLYLISVATCVVVV